MALPVISARREQAYSFHVREERRWFSSSPPGKRLCPAAARYHHRCPCAGGVTWDTHMIRFFLARFVVKPPLRRVRTVVEVHGLLHHAGLRGRDPQRHLRVLEAEPEHLIRPVAHLKRYVQPLEGANNTSH